MIFLREIVVPTEVKFHLSEPQIENSFLLLISVAENVH